MKIALAQTDIKWEDKAANMLAAENFISRAASEKARLVVFPEMSLTGFSLNVEKTAEDPENSPTIKFFTESAKKYGISVGFGVMIKNNDRAFNKFIICDAEGKILCNYSKIHPFSSGLEAKYLTGGDALCFCKIDDVTFSPLICYDLRFPEIFQLCSDKSEVIIVIANWPEQRRAHWITLLKARALENQCYVVGVNRCGTEPKNKYSGDSLVVTPYGDIISEPLCAEGLITADIDVSLVKKYRDEFQLKFDRRNELYAELYSQKTQI